MSLPARLLAVTRAAVHPEWADRGIGGCRALRGHRRSLVTSGQCCNVVTDGESRGKAAGNIGTFFVNLGAEAGAINPELVALKEAIRPAPAVLEASWKRLEAALVAEGAEILRRGSEVVPVVSRSDIEEHGGSIPAGVADEVRRRGVVVVKDVVSADQALEWKAGVLDYLQDNPGHTGFPEDDPQIYEIYWSAPQVEARQHPSTVAAMRAVNRLWAAGGGRGDVDVETPITYVDRLRMRKPGDTKFALGPHIDGGSLERWQDGTYRAVYQDILDGCWEAYDPYSLQHRPYARMDLYNAANACSAFRTWQGWMSLSDCAPNGGTLRVLPLLREATAFVLLRPFLEDVPEGLLCGGAPGRGQDVTEEWHKTLCDLMVPIPKVAPGDMVFWHCDTIHSVESVHRGTEDASVFFIPAAPMCDLNRDYLRKQAETLRRGITPPDFPGNDSEVSFRHRATPDLLSPLGREMMGL